MDNEISLKAIHEIRELSFFIPAYQRGFRWTKRQVRELLDDVHEFFASNPTQEEFYCLQPIVVREHEKHDWELIDGQQRLTTLYLILNYFNQLRVESRRREIYSICYQTRPGSESFLKNVQEEQSKENIDYHYMFEASKEIENWFKGRDELENDIESTFLNKVKVIWYQLDPNSNPIDVFTRLNVGKIPLTNSELVKALFLKSSNFEVSEESKKLSIAQEWDQIEKKLQEDDFWYFVSNVEINSPQRIELVLKLLADELYDQLALESDTKRDSAYIFLALYAFYMQPTEEVSFTRKWNRVKETYNRLEEWHKDRELFHIVGFLINQGVTISKLQRLAEEERKSTFVSKLKKEVFRTVFHKSLENVDEDLRDFLKVEIAELEYSSDRTRIRSILLLFNICSLLSNERSNTRFQFDLFKTEEWQLEHIRSVSTSSPGRAEDQKAWLEQLLEFGTGKQGQHIAGLPEILEKANEAIDSGFDADEFEALYIDCISCIDREPDPDLEDSIGNLTLLSASINQSYGNSVFPIKKQRIVSLSRSGAFIPLCTQNVFLKLYSDGIEDNLIWGKEDAESYKEAIAESLADFFDGRAA